MAQRQRRWNVRKCLSVNMPGPCGCQSNQRFDPGVCSMSVGFFHPDGIPRPARSSGSRSRSDLSRLLTWCRGMPPTRKVHYSNAAVHMSSPTYAEELMRDDVLGSLSGSVADDRNEHPRSVESETCMTRERSLGIKPRSRALSLLHERGATDCEAGAKF